jgi:hypothetical protein
MLDSIVVPMLAAAVPLALTIVGAKMSWMKDRPCMIWIYIGLGVVGLCVIGWQGCRNKSARDKADSERERAEIARQESEARAANEHATLLANQSKMASGLDSLGRMVAGLVKASAMNEGEKQKLVTQVSSAIVDLKESVQIGESIQVDVIRAGSNGNSAPSVPTSR